MRGGVRVRFECDKLRCASFRNVPSRCDWRSQWVDVIQCNISPGIRKMPSQIPDSERRRVLSVTKRANLPANERLRSDPTDPISIYGSHDTE